MSFWTITNLAGLIKSRKVSSLKPTSITFNGKLYDESEVLAVAKAYQDATGFHLKHPVL